MATNLFSNPNPTKKSSSISVKLNASIVDLKSTIDNLGLARQTYPDRDHQVDHSSIELRAKGEYVLDEMAMCSTLTGYTFHLTLGRKKYITLAARGHRTETRDIVRKLLVNSGVSSEKDAGDLIRSVREQGRGISLDDINAFCDYITQRPVQRMDDNNHSNTSDTTTLL